MDTDTWILLQCNAQHLIFNKKLMLYRVDYLYALAEFTVECFHRLNFINDMNCNNDRCILSRRPQLA